MSEVNDIARAIKSMAGVKDATLVGIVDSFDVHARTVDVVVDGLTYFGVRLQAVTGLPDGLFIKPKDGSFVILERLGQSNEMAVAFASELELVFLKIGNTELEADADGFAIARGTESLRKLLEDIASACKRITVPTNTGASGVPVNVPEFDSILNRIPNLFKR